jgi:MGT family glycosyltransferase
MTKHIAMFLLYGKGHIYPTVELCSLLIGRGHKVTCVIEERAAAYVAEVGAKPIPYKDRSSLEMPEDLYGHPHDARWWDQLASNVYPDFLRLATDTLSQISDRFSHDEPELVLYDRWAFAGRIFSSNVGIAAIQLNTHFACFNNFIHRDRGICFNPPPMLRFAEQLDSFLWEHGIRTDRNLWHSEALNLCFLPKPFQHHAEHFDERFCFVGACLNRPYTRSWMPPPSGKPVILISDQSVGYRARQDFLPFIDALSGRDYHVVLSSVDPELRFDFLPENFELDRVTSHLEILPHASLSISLGGGIGTTLEALYHGVPLLVSPPTPFAEEVAYRVCELGVGASFPRNELTVDVIKWAVEGLLSDPTVRFNVLQAKDLFRQSGGAALAADRVEAML